MVDAGLVSSVVVPTAVLVALPVLGVFGVTALVFLAEDAAVETFVFAAVLVALETLGVCVVLVFCTMPVLGVPGVVSVGCGTTQRLKTKESSNGAFGEHG